MSDLFSRLAARARGEAPRLKPKLPSAFEEPRFVATTAPVGSAGLPTALVENSGRDARAPGTPQDSVASQVDRIPRATPAASVPLNATREISTDEPRSFPPAEISPAAEPVRIPAPAVRHVGVPALARKAAAAENTVAPAVPRPAITSTPTALNRPGAAITTPALNSAIQPVPADAPAPTRVSAVTPNAVFPRLTANASPPTLGAVRSGEAGVAEASSVPGRPSVSFLLYENAPHHPDGATGSPTRDLTVGHHSPPLPRSRVSPASTAPSVPPVVNITIGRIEIRARPPAASPTAPPSSEPKLSLDDYLRRTSSGAST